jgi:lipoprotein-anchoring transpeptidase ErfK/SrfK
MFPIHRWRVAMSTVVAMILSTASGYAGPLALNEPVGFPGSIFQQILPDPAPQAMPDVSATEESAVLPERFHRQIVAYSTNEAPGTIVIDTPHTYLYYVLGQGRAIRYGIGVGREGFTWAGVQSIARKQEWPDWNPPAEMIARQPYLPRFMAGGPGNPLGARAMYLGSTMYRIHGTNAPDTIGKRVSSGCIRLTNENVIDLFNRTAVGAKVVVLPMNGERARPEVARIHRPAPVHQRVSQSAQPLRATPARIEPPRPPAALPHYTQSSLFTGASTSLLY